MNLNLNIRDVRTVLLTGPCTGDPYTSKLKQRRSAAFVEIYSDTGQVGIGETYFGFQGIPEVIPPIVDFFKPILINAETDAIYTISQRLSECCSYWGRVGPIRSVISAIEAALWDLKGKIVGLPVYELLGGRCHDQLPAYATGGPANWPLEELLAKIDFYLHLGFRAFKVATGYLNEETRHLSSPRALNAIVDLEVTKVAAMRRHVGSDVRILLDGHMGFKQGPDRWDLATARAVLRALEPYDIFFFEEPLPYTDPRGYGDLNRSTTIRVAGGESLTTLEEFHLFADQQAFDVAQPDAAWLSLSEFVDVGRMFARHGKWVASHAWGAGAAVMQNVHAAFATPNTIMLEIPPAAGPLHTEIWEDSLQLKDGVVLPPTAPGLGVTLTDEVKETYRFVPGAEEFLSVPGKMMRS